MTTSQIVFEVLDKVLDSNTVAVILGALFASYFGFKQYRNQKLYEGINEKYFKSGIEKLISYLQSIRTKIEHNYSYSLKIISDFQSLDKETFLERYPDSELTEKDNMVSGQIPNSFTITSSILKNEHFNNVCMGIFAEAHFLNYFYMSTVLVSLHRALNGKNPSLEEKTRLFKKLTEKAKDIHREFDKELGGYLVVEKLEEILMRLKEIDVDSYKKLKNIYLDEKIKESLDDLKEIKA